MSQRSQILKFILAISFICLSSFGRIQPYVKSNPPQYVLRPLFTEFKAPHVKWTAQIDSNYHLIIIKRGGTICWQDTCYSKYATYVPSSQTLFYFNGELQARKLFGGLLWKSEPQPPMSILASRDSVITRSVGINKAPKIEQWEGEEGVLGEVYITAYSAHNGKLLWTSNEFKIGMPIWTDGQKLLTVHLDLRHGAIVALKKHRSPVPVWLELWRIGDRKRLWRERIKGIPPPITSYRQVDSRHVLIRFGRNGAVSWNGLFPLMGSTDIIAPIHPSRMKYGETVEIE